jgi:chorismate mutase
VESVEQERAAIRRLVQELGAARGERAATAEEVVRLRTFVGRRVLRREVDAYILEKYRAHVERDEQWPPDTTPEEFLESLRETVLDPRSSVYLSDETRDGSWSIYFSGRVPRASRGPDGSGRIVVIFNGEQHRFITGFQPWNNDDYIEQRSGFWLRQV